MGKITQDMKNNLFLSTPIFYSNGQPHLGHAFTVVLADSMKRWYRNLGFDVFMVTGTDEHGEKILKTAREYGMPEKQFVDENVKKFVDLWNLLGIDYDSFIRTTDEKHKDVVRKIFAEIEGKNQVYFGKWKGWYCVQCEENFSDKFVDNLEKKTCKLGHKLLFKNESSYFLKASSFRKWLSDEYVQRDKWILPDRYKKEMLNNFIINLEDLSISRENLSWGIKVREDDQHTFYVWFDALINYLTAVDWGNKNSNYFEKYWNSEESLVIHIIGKEICRFHSIYWPIILNILGIKQFDHLLVHGWLLMGDEKMSKSKGNILDPVELLKTLPRDGIRLFFMQLNYLEDSSVSFGIISSVYNSCLANTLGNLMSRFYGILSKKFDHTLPEYSFSFKFPEIDSLEEQLDNFMKIEYSNLVLENKFYVLVNKIFDLFRESSKLIELKKAWNLDKDDPSLRRMILFFYKLLCLGFWILSPILIDSSVKAAKFLNCDFVGMNLSEVLEFNFYESRKLNSLSEILFPRLNV